MTFLITASQCSTGPTRCCSSVVCTVQCAPGLPGVAPSNALFIACGAQTTPRGAAQLPARPRCTQETSVSHGSCRSEGKSQWSSPRHALTAQRPEQRSQRFCQHRRAACLHMYLCTYLPPHDMRKLLPTGSYGRQRSVMSPASRRSRVVFSRRLMSIRIFHE